MGLSLKSRDISPSLKATKKTRSRRCGTPIVAALSKKTFTNIEKAPLYERRLYKKLPNKHLRAYEIAIQTLKQEKDKPADPPYLPYDFDNDVWEFYFRVRLIQDYISGMTDQYAYDEYRNLHVLN
jgi:dGTPase